MASDMVKRFAPEIEKNASLWLETWDRMPIGFLNPALTSSAGCCGRFTASPS